MSLVTNNPAAVSGYNPASSLVDSEGRYKVVSTIDELAQQVVEVQEKLSNIGTFEAGAVLLAMAGLPVTGVVMFFGGPIVFPLMPYLMGSGAATGVIPATVGGVAAYMLADKLNIRTTDVFELAISAGAKKLDAPTLISRVSVFQSSLDMIRKRTL
jgi:hypothetical protein